MVGVQFHQYNVSLSVMLGVRSQYMLLPNIVTHVLLLSVLMSQLHAYSVIVIVSDIWILQQTYRRRMNIEFTDIKGEKN